MHMNMFGFVKYKCVFIICVHEIHIPVHVLCSHPRTHSHSGCDYALWTPGSWIIRSTYMYQWERKSRKYLTSEEERGRGGRFREAGKGSQEWTGIFKGLKERHPCKVWEVSEGKDIARNLNLIQTSISASMTAKKLMLLKTRVKCGV